MRRNQITPWQELQFAFFYSALSKRFVNQGRLVALVGIIVFLLALAGCGSGSKSNPVQPGTPTLAAVVAAQGNFSSGQTNASYSITVSNTGNGATTGTVTVADPPTGFNITAISGPGWGGCTPASPTCTRSDSLAAGQSFPPITVTGNVTAPNGTAVTIPVTVSGGGTTIPANTSPSVTVAAPALSITKTHSGSFNLGQQGATYTVTVKNGSSAGATNAKVTVTETVPAGETLVSMSGAGWTCPGAGGANTCDRSDSLASAGAYPALTVTVNVSASATSPQTNQASVSGGGTASAASVNDPTTINTPDLSLLNTHTGAFTAGSNGTFNIVVSNGANAAPTVGTITVSDTLDTRLTFVSATASGWSCGAAAQVVTCTNPGPLAPGASATTIPVVVALSAAATGTISNTATVATQDDNNPANNSSTDSVSVTNTSACASTGSESLVDGAYAVLLKGFDGSGNPVLTGGVLTFNGANNNGIVTAGTIDMNLNSGVQLNLAVTSGSYYVGSDQRGCIAIATSAGNQTYRFSLGNISSGVASTGHVIGFDQTGPFITGIMRKQSGGPFTKASVNGSFAFGGSSFQNSAPAVGGGKLAIAGVISFDGNGAVTGGSQDLDQNGNLDGSAANTTWPASPIAITGGSYSVSANGRGTLTIISAAGTGNSVLYLVSPSEALFMTSDPQNTSGIVAGEALQQSGTPFSANPLSGTYVGADSGVGNNGGRSDLLLAGPLSAGNNSFSSMLQRNEGGAFTSSVFSGTYSVSSSGRMIMTTTAGLNHDLVFYLVSSSQAFYVIGNPSADSGSFESQSGGPFNTSAVNGPYAFGTIDPVILAASDVSGVSTFTPASAGLGVVQDTNANGLGPSPDVTQSATYAVDSTGLGMIPSGCTISVAPPTCQTIFYIVSPTKAYVMDVQSVHPHLLVANQ